MQYAKTIRPLKYGDFKRLKGMLGKYVEKTGDQALRKMISSAQAQGSASAQSSAEDEQNGQVITVFFDVIKQLAIHLDDELHAWFGDLLGVTPEQYEELPFDIDIQVLNQLKESPEIGDFFTGLSLLSSGTQWFQKLSKTLKSKFDSLIDSRSES